MIDALAARLGVDVGKKSFQALVGDGRLGSEKVLLIKPQTFMNVSGESVAPLIGYYRLTIDDLVVVHDDIDLALGQIKLAQGAGHGGHNGVRSIVDLLGTQSFFRVRVGVGRPPEQWDPADFVLSPFSSEERETAAETVARAADAVELLIVEGLLAAQQRFH